MSLRRKVSHFLALVVVAALAVGLMASPASAHMSAKKKAQIARQLRKAVKHNPRVVGKHWFLKKASLVNFKLPVTIRLRSSNSASNPNNANIDLGASLGQREIDLGGSLAAEIVFHDSYDGGALGNVDINILPSATKSLTSTSVPLLWNHDVSAPGTSWDSTLLAAAGIPGVDAASLAANGKAPGCSNVENANANANGNLPFGAGFPLGAGLAGVPIHQSTATDTTVGFAPAHITSNNAAVDNSIDAIQASSQIVTPTAATPQAVQNAQATNNNHIGGNPKPFPYSASSDPGGFTQPPSPADTVLRTNALSLGVAPVGQVNQSTNANGVAGSQNIVIGKSGGQANLFGNIPGKQYGIDVTVNLATTINSILRIEDQDAFAPLIVGGHWPAAIFSCAQVWTGGVQNYIPGVRLQGSLKISPAITPDGHLRIAKATISSLGDPARIALAACLVPYSAYNQETGNNTVPQPTSTNTAGDGSLLPSALPADPNNVALPPSAACNAPPTTLVANSAFPGQTVQSLNPALTTNGYTVTNSGSAVSVAGDLTVNNVSADVLVGDV